MGKKLEALPGDYVANFEFIHPKDIAAEFLQKNRSSPRPSTAWSFVDEVRPSDLYCYLGARFGPPNGLQNLFRSDDSDNLIHWEWCFKTATGFITIAGLNYRTEVRIIGTKLSDSEKSEFLRQVKSDFSNYGKEMAHLRKEHLEPWIEFVNPYQRLRGAVQQLMKELDELNLDPTLDALPNVLESDDIDAATKQWSDRAEVYSRAIGLSFGIRAMLPVMAESFINLLFFILARPTIRSDKSLFAGVFRLPMHVRVRSLPYYCIGFKGHIDSDH